MRTRSTKRGVATAALACLLLVAACGREEGAGTVTGAPIPAQVVASRAGAERETAKKLAAPVDKQILFGDLHVHSTFSIDAFMMSLPFMQGEGAHPVSDACDFARYCSGLDFWSINDHAESLTPLRWRQTKEAIRQCNARAGDPANPDQVAFLGWEWTQVGLTPKDHYGHKNVIFRETDEDRVPRRPIHSGGFAARGMKTPPKLSQRLLPSLVDPLHFQRYFNLFELQASLARVPECPEGVDTRELPDECLEAAETPAELFEKLDQWGFDSLVIPHGTTWGIYTPAGSSWDKQLVGSQHDPQRQRLVEVFSGHGNSEQYRSWRSVTYDANGHMQCPPPQDGFEPCCWRAGEIIRGRCDDPASAECERRVEDARRNFLDAGSAGRLTIPDSAVVEWGNCGTCPDCFLGAMKYRPASSVQYMMAISNFDQATPRNFQFGFIGSSDNHRARPGTGYKEYDRLDNTEAFGPKSARWYRRLYEGEPPEPLKAGAMKESVPFDRNHNEMIGFRLIDFERQASFFLTGGLVAVHSEGRSREQIWEALERREVYGTSGERILLWFDLLDGEGGVVPMGSAATVAGAPRFRARAAGSFEQLPGCPDWAARGIAPARLETLCRGECYNPSGRRKRVDRIEVVRIRRQAAPGEDVADLIDDPWKVLPCGAAGAQGCVVEFEDPEFSGLDREVLYYVRAIEEASPTINADLLRCSYDEAGNCVEVHPCYGDYRTPASDDCLAPSEERAWSSPIYVRPAPRG